MLTGNCLAIEPATAAPGQQVRARQQPAPSLPQDSARQGALRTYKTKLGNGKDKQVQLRLSNSNVQIVGHNGDEVIIENRDYTAPPKRAEGLKPLYHQAEDNTSLGLAVSKNNNTLSITQAARNGGRYVIKVPRNVSVVFRETSWEGGSLSISDVNGEIELKLNNTEATLTNVSGPVVANNTNGSIKVIFSSLEQSKPSAISTVSGDIDITLPAKDKANFKLRSMQGEIYTDFDMAVKRDNQNEELALLGGGGDIAGKVNGGGVEISVQSITSDIFIRKKK